ncbi:MAG: hypothetical protein JWQ71_4941 [Pedosphaera sp.]|nr:hypothetical protein [Pedosphaera sp.]
MRIRICSVITRLLNTRLDGRVDGFKGFGGFVLNVSFVIFQAFAQCRDRGLGLLATFAQHLDRGITEVKAHEDVWVFGALKVFDEKGHHFFNGRGIVRFDACQSDGGRGADCGMGVFQCGQKAKCWPAWLVA